MSQKESLLLLKFMGIDLFFFGNLWVVLKEVLNANGIWMRDNIFFFVFLIVTINKSLNCLTQI